MSETSKRSIIKSMSWRFLATLTTIIVVFIFTGSLALSLGVGAVEVVAKLLLYYAHERTWNKIMWGKNI